jgi:prepilin-type N-terminal cleavage/methylation domain-containing protein
MTNKKGFTLMELLVAVFIGSMVTIALVSVWKAASMQTSEGQRQTIVRNNLSIFARGLHRDITEADVILFPTSTLTNSGSTLLVGAYNVIRDDEKVNVYKSALGPSNYFAYCYDSGSGSIRKQEGVITNSEAISAFISGLGACSTGYGPKVMDNVDSVSITTPRDSESERYFKDATFNVAMRIYKDFGGKSIPINIIFDHTFTTAGGA